MAFDPAAICSQPGSSLMEGQSKEDGEVPDGPEAQEQKRQLRSELDEEFTDDHGLQNYDLF